MTMASQAGAVLGTAAAIGAAASLLRASTRPSGPVRPAYRWFALAAGLWGAAVLMAALVSAPAGGTAPLVPFADIPALLALLAAGAGFALLAAAPQGRAWGRPSWRDLCQSARYLADGFVAVAALFLIGWITLFSGIFARSGVSPGAFAVELARPLADLVLLGVALPLVVCSGRRGLLPYLGVAAITLADALAVGARVRGAGPDAVAMTAAVAGFVLLAVVPWVPAGWPDWTRWRTPAGRVARRAGTAAAGAAVRSGPRARAPGDAHRAGGLGALRPSVTTALAAAGALIAALALIAWALAGEPRPRPVVPLVAGVMLLVLAARLLDLIQHERWVAWSQADAGRQFQQLADRTSDAVLLCDPGGTIRYAGGAVAGYGYTPADLRGRALTDLLHPEDLAGGTRAVRAVLTGEDDGGRTYPCRVRAADGTWRHVLATVSRYIEPGSRGFLLVTARDVSDQVALRREVAHLTFHDGLTGLPNRAYVEQRARDTLDPRVRAATEPAGAVILVDLDEFSTVNDEVGHDSGDLLLAQVAHRLRAAVQPRDTVARWGGDEFAILVEGGVSAEEVVDVAEGLARGVASAPFRVGDQEVRLTASVGVALCGEGPASHAWRNADMAVNKAQEAGGGRVEVFAAGTGNGRDHDRISGSETKLLSG